MIHGSCVSRDLFNAQPHLGEISEYVARQSWLSAGNPWRRPAHPDGLASSFRSRQLHGDFDGTGFERIAVALGRGDHLVLDLCDERLGVYVDLAGQCVTASQELKESLWYEHVREQGMYLPFGESEHLAAWTAAALRLRDALARRHAMGRTVLLAPDFADRDESGAAMAGSLGRSVHEWNEAYAPYYRAARELGFDVVRIRDVEADSGHRWGLAAFHYTGAVYAEAAREIAARWLRAVAGAEAGDEGGDRRQKPDSGGGAPELTAPRQQPSEGEAWLAQG